MKKINTDNKIKKSTLQTLLSIVTLCKYVIYLTLHFEIFYLAFTFWLMEINSLPLDTTIIDVNLLTIQILSYFFLSMLLRILESKYYMIYDYDFYEKTKERIFSTFI